jgi:hypothetical protein
MSFATLNFYTFAAARGQFLRSDVQALLREAPVSLFSDILAHTTWSSAARPRH